MYEGSYLFRIWSIAWTPNFSLMDTDNVIQPFNPFKFVIRVSIAIITKMKNTLAISLRPLVWELTLQI